VDTEQWRAVLQEEFAAEPGSFLLALRCDLRWDRAAFSRLTEAMEQCCQALTGSDVVERWLADGFWYLSTFARSWTDHGAWAEDPKQDEIDAGIEKLEGLAYWFFTGEPAATQAATRRAPERTVDSKRSTPE
jgi:hypothetical protein